MERYKIRCTEEQTRKALELGAPIYVYDKINSDSIRELDVTLKGKVELSNGLYAEIPTTEQMIGWLEEKGVCISIEHNTTNRYAVSLEGLFGYIPLGIDSRKEATIAAIGAALDYLIKSKVAMKKEEIERAASAKYPHPQIVDMQAAGHQGFVEGAEWAKQEMIEKVIKFLNANQDNLNYIDEEGNLYSDGFIEDFIKHLEE